MSVALVSTVLVAVAAWLVLRARASGPKLDIPYLQFEGDNSLLRYLNDTRSLMRKGYAEYIKQGKPFSMLNHVDFQSPLVILPPKYLEEVRSAPQTKLSFPLSLEKSTIINDIGGPKMTDEAILVVRHDVTKALSLYFPAPTQTWNLKLLQPNWTPVVTYQFLLNVFSRITARSLVGPELCDNQEWQDIILGFTNSAFKASHGVRARYHPWTRWLAKYFDGDVKDVYRYRKRAGNLLRPILETRKAEYKARGKGEKVKHEDGIQWILDAYHSTGSTLTPDKLAQDEFIITIASIHSSAATALSILYDLMDRPECLVEIQEEISKVLKQYGSWTRQSLAALRIMDSFMKESQRVHTLQQLTLQRMAVEDFTFKDGLHLPAGTQIAMPNELIGLDPDLHENAETFDAKRFLRKREQIDPNKFHFASISEDMLPFGSGLHACPGRFLAQDVMKLMFIRLLTRYEFKYPEGVDSRPANIERHHNIMPNTGLSLLFKEKN
ncbi:cytochrome P450 [Chaetomium tenue]|uniref:Cytochrome P450 n=1 Tax=Chaetomium tenue TaxID=1854479 RepID=A0ACB7P0E8_9PEZI|nr:cytochrome P450 [Chaetomium globosum]